MLAPQLYPQDLPDPLSYNNFLILILTTTQAPRTPEHSDTITTTKTHSLLRTPDVGEQPPRPNTHIPYPLCAEHNIPMAACQLSLAGWRALTTS